MPNFAFIDFVGSWEHLSTRVTAHSTDLPHLQGMSTQLEAAVADAKGLNMRQDILRAELNQVTKDLGAVMALGRELATRLRSNVRGHYGNKNEKLIEFGIRPFRRRQRQEEPVIEPVQPNPPPGTE